MICLYCKKDLVPFRINKPNQKANLIGWLCECTDEIRDRILKENNVSNSKSKVD